MHYRHVGSAVLRKLQVTETVSFPIRCTSIGKERMSYFQMKQFHTKEIGEVFPRNVKTSSELGELAGVKKIYQNKPTVPVLNQQPVRGYRNGTADAQAWNAVKNVVRSRTMAEKERCPVTMHCVCTQSPHQFFQGRRDVH